MQDISNLAVPRILLMVFLFVSLLAVSSKFSYANNLDISASDADDGLVEQDQSDNTIKVQFDISWDNAWNDSINHDAVWVFVKYSTTGSAPYSHAKLKTAGTNPTGFSRGTRNSGAFGDVDIVVPPDKMGAFIIPGTSGSGSVNMENIQLVWNYGADGITDATVSNATIDVKVFGIEMVYIPEGGFIAGGIVTKSNDANGNAYGGDGEFEYGDGDLNLAPHVSSEEGIRFRGNSADAWYYNTDIGGNDEATGAAFDVSEAFPKGFQAFYLMKYEITQGQYVNFLNTLTSTQDSNRFPNSNGFTRHTVTGTSGARSTTRPDRAMNYMNWVDFCAFLDWAALRPMSELEFEKAARGPLSPVTDEYAWGTASGTDCTSLSGTENGTETCSTGGANANIGATIFTGGDGGSGPVRVGIFAAGSGNDTRAESGAGYYGNMELTGNVSEMAVTLGTPEGRGFSGTHGDGALTTAGTATNDDWPGFSAGNGVNGFAGHGHRGAGHYPTDANLANRVYAAEESTSRSGQVGGRGARTENI